MPTGSDCLGPVELGPKIGLGSVCGTTTASAREGANNLAKRKDSLCMLSYQSFAWPTCRGYEGKVGSLSSRTLNMHDVCFYLIGPEILIELAFTGWHLTGERERDKVKDREAYEVMVGCDMATVSVNCCCVSWHVCVLYSLFWWLAAHTLAVEGDWQMLMIWLQLYLMIASYCAFTLRAPWLMYCSITNYCGLQVTLVFCKHIVFALHMCCLRVC